MKWFDEHKEFSVGSDSEVPGCSYRAITQIADEALGDAEMIQFVREDFQSQKAFGEFLGVGESTVAGWMKSGSFPDYAKRATLAAYYSKKYFRQLTEAKRDVARPRVVKDGDHYLIVRFNVDEAGVTIGEIFARDIPTKKAALVFASGLRAWELLDQAEDVLDQEIEGRDEEDSGWIQDLKDEILLERTRTFAHDELLELERKHNEAIKDLNLDDPVTTDSTKTDEGGAEQ